MSLTYKWVCAGVGASVALWSANKANKRRFGPEASIFPDINAFKLCATSSDLPEPSSRYQLSSQSSSPFRVMDEALEKELAFARSLEEAKREIKAHYHRIGAPGIVVAVAVDGKVVLNEAYGYRDLENRVSHTPDTSMRIASISKAMTACMVAKLVEEGKLDLDKPVTHYVPKWPKKHPEFSVRQLMSHLAGIRHYTKKSDLNKVDKDKEADIPEFRIKEKIKTTEEALDLFKEDELLSEPGEEFNYSTHGYTLLAAVIEAASGEQFSTHAKRTFKRLGLGNTHLDENDAIIPNRSRYYLRDGSTGVLQNAPFVDNSWKYAGGGFVSTTADLESGQQPAQEARSSAYLKHDTVSKLLWQPAVKVPERDTLWHSDTHYGLGWALLDVDREREIAFGAEPQFTAYHIGTATGATSILMIAPGQSSSSTSPNDTVQVKGVVVAVLCNLERFVHTEYYLRDPKTGLLKNAPSVDNSWKWAGGGFVSTTEDLLKFAHAMLFCYQFKGDKLDEFVSDAKCEPVRGYLKHDTIRMLWNPVVRMDKNPNSLREAHYGLGWEVLPEDPPVAFARDRNMISYHTGGATGATSILLIAPSKCPRPCNGIDPEVKGVVVAVLCNLESMGHQSLALELVRLFRNTKTSS